MRTYVDSSVVLRHILSGDHALNALSLSDEVGLSDLLIIECQRVLQRERMAAHLDDQQYSLSVSHRHGPGRQTARCRSFSDCDRNPGCNPPGQRYSLGWG